MANVDPLALEEPSYLKAALTNQYNLILCGGAAAFAAALASWAPAVAGLAVEAFWLLVGPNLPAFRRRTDALRAVEESRRVVASLPPEYAERVAAVKREIVDIERLCASRPGVTRDEKVAVAARLRPIADRLVEACVAHDRLKRVAHQGQPAELQAELASLHQSLGTETDLGVRSSLRRALTVTERRIKLIEGNDAAVRSIELGMQTLEKSLVYIKECAAGIATLPELCAEIDAALSQFGRVASVEPDPEADLVGPRPSALPPALN